MESGEGVGCLRGCLVVFGLVLMALAGWVFGVGAVVRDDAWFMLALPAALTLQVIALPAVYLGAGCFFILLKAWLRACGVYEGSPLGSFGYFLFFCTGGLLLGFQIYLQQRLDFWPF